MLYVLLPLVLLALESIIPYIETICKYRMTYCIFKSVKDYLATHPDDPIEVEANEEEIPVFIRLIFSRLFASNPQLLDRGVRVGAAVIRLGGLVVLINALYRYFVFFKLLRPRPIVGVKLFVSLNEVISDSTEDRNQNS